MCLDDYVIIKLNQTNVYEFLMFMFVVASKEENRNA